MHSFIRPAMAVLLPIFFAMLVGCTPPIQAEQAKKIAERFYDHIQKKEFDQAIALYDNRRLMQKPPHVWSEELVRQNAELGDLQQFTLTHFEVNTQYRGRLYIFEYATTYTRQTATETLTLFEDHDGKTIKVVSHDVSL